MRRVVVTGLGAVTPLGLGVHLSWKRLIAGHSGIVSLRGEGAAFAQQQCQVAGLVPRGRKENGAWTASEWGSRDDQRRMSKYMQYAMAASQEALEDAGWSPRTEREEEMTGVCLGSGIGSFEEAYNTSLAYEKGGPKKVSPFFVPKLLINLAAGHISMKYRFKGPTHAATTACTTGAHSIGDASRFIAFGDADVMLAGGAESCIHPLAFTGFERSRSLATAFNDTPEQASRPFDKSRNGFVISEGAAILVLESLSHALARSAPIYAELVGYGSSSDAHHITAPPMTGYGAYRAMRVALRNAAIKPAQVDYINAHATGTVIGDAAEMRAIKRLMLEEDGPDECKRHAADVNVSSTKGALGHLLGAAGAVEALISILAMKHNILPPTLNLTQPDCAALAGGFEQCNLVPLVAQPRGTGGGGGGGGDGSGGGGGIDVVLSNSFGFGGTNASLCFRRYRG